MESMEITVQQLKEKLDKGEKPVILDVREQSEYARANIGGRLIPLSELSKRISDLDPGQEIIVHCHHGGRSQRAVEFLHQKGFTNVKNLLGGIDAWSVKIDPKVPRY